MSAPRSKQTDKTPETDDDVEAQRQQKKKQQGNNNSPRDTAMSSSKLAPSLKALINAPFARPGQAPAPRHIRDIYARIAREARERQYGDRPWITLSAAATITLNSPASLLTLHSLIPTLAPSFTPLAAAELLREIGLKCISFNGIPRTINTLNSFKAALASEPWVAQLSTTPTRNLTLDTLPGVAARGRELWKSIYTPLDEKLEAKLAEAHPDLPVYILAGHYGPLLADPEGHGKGGLGTVGRTMTSVVAVACLRAQTGVGPQVLSHVFGLRKGVEQGAHVLEEGLEGGEEKGVERLAADEGCEWMLRSVDAIAGAIRDGEGEEKAKL
ncbi:hypothetical protein C8A05DRAFT_35684 [Staphylotrichum tortipilum]|uniref:Dol-P-Man:Man(5)GlcNAc(2)-PP-Dol alpha-1,3-mannosyltransferase n=1 Tax=Staphylotrichum tortipilum TaxID=2831512 RepID=A0AAN6MH87_9PEZI|nr:hypothetical protein C8A05DRAFT_35684 [Staphylotrichum longicolle]